ncbi:MAG: protein kinase [Akkermansia sp.]|nr:protein kinase [Akkermansia sp.]
MQEVAALPPGTILGNEKYKILVARGQGGFGITYAGWDFSLERNVAIKECFPQDICVRDAETAAIAPRTPALQEAYLAAMADLQKEARLLAGLNHPNIVQVHDVFAANGSLFCVMHWLEGDTLRDRLDAAEAEDALIPPEQVEEWLRQLLDALGYMHAQGVIHRDIKPENIMFNESGRPVLVDFGSAVNISRLTHTLTQGAFSASYAAPEQISGKGKIGPWTDFYSLAATWYEVFSNCAAEETVRRMMEDSLAPLEKLVPARVHAAPRMAAGIMRNLELRTAARCQSAAEWLAMLDGRPQPRKPRRKGKLRSLLWACALAAAVLGWCVGGQDAAPPAQDEESHAAETADGEVDLDALTERAWKHYGLDKLLEKRKPFVDEQRGIISRYRKECAALLERFRRDPSVTEHLDVPRRAFAELYKQAQQQIDELENRYQKGFIEPYEAILESMKSGHGWKGLSALEKLALTHAVSSRINTRMNEACGNSGLYYLSNIDHLSAAQVEEDGKLQDVIDRHQAARDRQETTRQEEGQRQRETEREPNMEALYEKVRAQSGMVELMQKAERMRKEYAAIPAEGLQTMERIAREGIAKAKAAPIDDVSKAQSDAYKRIQACECDYKIKTSNFRSRYRKEVNKPMNNIVANCGRTSKFTFVTEDERDLLPDIRDRIREEIEPYLDLPFVADADGDAAQDMLREGIREMERQREAVRDAAAEKLYHRVVDEKKLESLMAQRKELERKRSALYKACKEEINAYADKVVPQIKALPRKQWNAAIESAEQQVVQISYKYEQKDKPLVVESRKVASMALSYLDCIKKAKGKEFTGLTAEEKKLMPRVAHLAMAKVDGGEYQMGVTMPMTEGCFVTGNPIEDRVYEGEPEEDDEEGNRRARPVSATARANPAGWPFAIHPRLRISVPGG